MKISVHKGKRVETRDLAGNKNGWILELNSENDNWTKFIKGQVYLTVVNPGEQKGFHLHKLKTNHVTCIKGLLTLAVFDGKRVQEFKIGQDNFVTVMVPPMMPLALYNRGKADAYVINYCYPAYDPEVDEQEEVDIDWNPNESEK